MGTTESKSQPRGPHALPPLDVKKEWKKEEALSQKKRRERYACKEFVTMDDIPPWSKDVSQALDSSIKYQPTAAQLQLKNHIVLDEKLKKMKSEWSEMNEELQRLKSLRSGEEKEEKKEEKKEEEKEEKKEEKKGEEKEEKKGEEKEEKKEEKKEKKPENKKLEREIKEIEEEIFFQQRRFLFC